MPISSSILLKFPSVAVSLLPLHPRSSGCSLQEQAQRLLSGSRVASPGSKARVCGGVEEITTEKGNFGVVSHHSRLLHEVLET